LFAQGLERRTGRESGSGLLRNEKHAIAVGVRRREHCNAQRSTAAALSRRPNRPTRTTRVSEVLTVKPASRGVKHCYSSGILEPMKKIAFITGAASGIGAATARLLNSDDHFVYIADIQREAGQALADELGNAAFINVNVRDEADFERALDQVMSEQGRLDVMVNNAAIVGVLGPIATLPVDQYDFSQEIIQRSVVLGTKHAARLMQAQKSGAIVNIASVAGIRAGYSPHVYAACKAAVVQFTESVAIELAEDNVRCNAICPGAVATPIHTGVRDERWLERIEKIREAAVDEQPMPRMAEPSEIAEAVAWLASDRASYVTGHALVVDGGLSAGRLWRQQPQFFREFHPVRGV